MPKVKLSKTAILRNYIKEFKCLKEENGTLLCSTCSVTVSFERRSSVVQHMQTAMHVRRSRVPAGQEGSANNQLFLSESIDRNDEFCMDLATMLVSADIPVWKLDQPPVREFFSKYLKSELSLPSESTIRKNYIPKLYEQKMDVIRNDLKHEYLWVSVDETTDACGRFVVNVLAGALKEDSKTHLIDVQYIDSTNHATVAHVIVDALKTVLGEGNDFSKILLLVTDSAAYMHKMADGISSLLPNCIHVTCLAHSLHRIADFVRSNNSAVDSMIANAKKVFLKAPRRITLFKELNPNLALPPKPVITRWGTWLQAVDYYAEYFDEVKLVVDALDSNEAVSVAEVQNNFSNTDVRNQLTYIKANFSNVPKAIQQLECRTLTAPESWTIFCNAVQSLPNTEVVQEKLKSVLDRNRGLQCLVPILLIIDPSCSPLSIVSDQQAPNLQPAALAAYKFAPLTTVDVERSFSRYKNVLRSNRHGFTKENLRKYMIVHANC